MAKLPKFEDWKAPWETKGEDFDEEAARRYIYNLTRDKEGLQEKVATANQERDEAKAEVTEKQKELDEVTASNSTDADAVRKAQDKVREAEAKAEKAESAALRLEVALDKGLTAVQAKRLLGSTKEELESDADELVESFGGQGKAAEDEEDEDEDGVPRRTPRRTFNNPTDNEDGTGAEPDYAKIVAGFDNRVI